mgnify:CR=1 FL=1
MIKPLFNFNQNFKIDFFSVRKLAFSFSVVLIISSFFFLWKQKLNLGIDFIGGIMIDAKFSSNPNINQLRLDLGNLSLGNFEIQEFGSPDNISLTTCNWFTNLRSTYNLAI